MRSSRARVDVVQDDLLEAEPLRLGEQRAVDERDAEAAAADDGQFHAIVTSIPAESTAARQAAGSGASVTSWSSDSGPHTRTTPLIANLAASASSTTQSAAAIISRLIGTSTIVVSHTPRSESTALVPEDRHVGLELAQRVLGQDADERAVVAADDPAREHELDVRVGHQLLDHGEVRRHHRQLAPVQVARQLQRRGADVDHHRLAVLDQRGRGGAEAVLDVQALDLDLAEARLVPGVDRAAVDALELAVAGERGQIAPHGHLRHAEALGEVGHVGAPPADGAQDLLTALGGKQRHGLFDAVRNGQTSISFELGVRQKCKWTLGQVAPGSPIPLPGEVRKHVPKRKRPCHAVGSVAVTVDV